LLTFCLGWLRTSHVARITDVHHHAQLHFKIFLTKEEKKKRKKGGRKKEE
jgi:hypothetical protein